MSDDLVIRQLRAIRDLVDNALALLGVEDTAPSADVCTHPKAERRAAGVMGDQNRFFCMRCQTFVESPIAPTAAAGAEG